MGEGNDRQQGRRKPTEHKAAQEREETQLLPGTRVRNTDLILAQLQEKHKESHGTHTHTEAAAATHGAAWSVPLSSVVSRVARPG